MRYTESGFRVPHSNLRLQTLVGPITYSAAPFAAIPQKAPPGNPAVAVSFEHLPLNRNISRPNLRWNCRDPKQISTQYVIGGASLARAGEPACGRAFAYICQPVCTWRKTDCLRAGRYCREKAGRHSRNRGRGCIEVNRPDASTGKTDRKRPAVTTVHCRLLCWGQAILVSKRRFLYFTPVFCMNSGL